MEAPPAFLIWAPTASPWAAWTKPVLFAHWYSHPPAPSELPVVAVDVVPTADGSQAIVVDAPGAEAVAIGVALARLGYRPVPLFNGCPGPSALVDVAPVMAALHRGADALTSITLAHDAPPAFLLDSRRMTGTPMPRWFDNRWVTTPQDFPSANRLRAAGITTVLVVRAGGPEDLDHVLARWSDGGLTLVSPGSPGSIPLTVTRPTGYRLLFARVLVLLGLRRSSAGGFGGMVPEPSQGGG